MGEGTKIEWADHTFNPWMGCTKVSAGCAHCYAATETPVRVLRVNGRELWGRGKPRARTGVANWKRPVAWNRAAKVAGRRVRVFCASLADWLDDEVPLEWLAELMDLIRETPHLDWLLLTKRPENFGRLGEAMLHAEVDTRYWLSEWSAGEAPHNVWVGASVEDQSTAKRRVPELLRIPAAVRFLSAEPLLGPVDLDRVRDDAGDVCLAEIDWVIAGGESGPEARPMNPFWLRTLRDDCQGAGVPFLFKQWGEWSPAPGVAPNAPGIAKGNLYRFDDGYGMERIGKKAAGRELDGRVWDEFPKAKGGAA